jgi:hypothetical protein
MEMEGANAEEVSMGGVFSRNSDMASASSPISRRVAGATVARGLIAGVGMGPELKAKTCQGRGCRL